MNWKKREKYALGAIAALLAAGALVGAYMMGRSGVQELVSATKPETTQTARTQTTRTQTTTTTAATAQEGLPMGQTEPATGAGRNDEPPAATVPPAGTTRLLPRYW